MNWDRIEGNWKRIRGNAAAQWDEVSEGQLASNVLETCGTWDDESERGLTDWQQRLREIELAA